LIWFGFHRGCWVDWIREAQSGGGKSSIKLVMTWARVVTVGVDKMGAELSRNQDVTHRWTGLVRGWDGCTQDICPSFVNFGDSEIYFCSMKSSLSLQLEFLHQKLTFISVKLNFCPSLLNYRRSPCLGKIPGVPQVQKVGAGAASALLLSVPHC
jgi:hypothetical protein